MRGSRGRARLVDQRKEHARRVGKSTVMPIRKAQRPAEKTVEREIHRCNKLLIILIFPATAGLASGCPAALDQAIRDLKGRSVGGCDDPVREGLDDNGCRNTRAAGRGVYSDDLGISKGRRSHGFTLCSYADFGSRPSAVRTEAGVGTFEESFAVCRSTTRAPSRSTALAAFRLKRRLRSANKNALVGGRRDPSHPWLRSSPPLRACARLALARCRGESSVGGLRCRAGHARTGR